MRDEPMVKKVQYHEPLAQNTIRNSVTGSKPLETSSSQRQFHPLSTTLNLLVVDIPVLI